MQPIRVGKVKEVYDEGETLLFKFTDKISVFDKMIPSLIPHKGESLCRTSAYWFRMASESAKVDTHFIDMPAPNEMRVKKFFVPEGKGSPYEIEYVIPLEFIMRYYVAGSLFDRLKDGTLKPDDVGLNHMPKYGEELDDPFFEVTTKYEKYDRVLTKGEIIEIGGMTGNELNNIRETILKIDRRLNKQVLGRGLIHADGKKEFAFGASRQPVIIDTFGTADEDRFWDLESYNRGEVVELSKESVRQYYRSIGYHEKLYAARKSGQKEPDIPPLPQDMVEKTSRLYVEMFERLTGQKW
ncbi:MAG: phosphoribosylaminoimidazolesuccinocarboxamide synthase [Candidatus Thermoplasmatota archaeon]|nr:phosphoribosylaminoimidazolesuccinocarboxamide synthase [Candidatus Thermoplasmatota archaeon]